MLYYSSVCFEISQPETQDIFISLQSHSSQLIGNPKDIFKEAQPRKFFKSRSQPIMNTRIQVEQDSPTASNMGFDD